MPSFTTQGTNLIGHRIDQGRLEFVSVLGFGAYGVVYRAVDVTSRSHRMREYAVKCLMKAGLDTRQRQFQRREIALHGLASAHKNVVTMYRTIEEGDYVFVILDYCEDGDLFGMITERQRYIGDDFLIKKVFLQIVDAVDYCHSLGIYHRDLKPENILCTNQGENVFIGDFGLATSERVSSDFGCGSTFYMSPECQGGLFERLESYSTQANDIWSLGIILVNLTCGRNPWRQACQNDETFRAYLQNPNFLRTILPISQNLNFILRRIFTVDPRQRITLKQLRVLIQEIDTFNMSESELRHAHAAAQQAHAAVAKPARHAYVAKETAAYAAREVDGVDSPGSSGSSDYQTESDGSEYNVQIQQVPPYLTPLTPSPDTPALAINRSRSSSGDESSLPPTPETIAADGTAIPVMDGFELDTKSTANIAVGKLRIHNPSSPDVISSGMPNPYVL